MDLSYIRDQNIDGTYGNNSMSEKEYRELVRAEFFKTYDVMTGIRIAATLGGFFSMMILLVLYKNYCKTSKTLSEEQLNAAVTAAAEEEDRALAAALEATAFYTSINGPRTSLGNMSAPLCSPRFSSIGGNYMQPPIKFYDQYPRGKSLPGSALMFEHQPDSPPGMDVGEDECNQLPLYGNFGHYLNVPQDNRRLSSVTCSSADTSYLERRGSAFEMGLPVHPHFVKADGGKLCEQPWDFYYPIDIQVIQPTPDISPATSEPTLYDEQSDMDHRGDRFTLQVPGYDYMHRLSIDRSDIGLAPLASISSLASFSGQSSASCSAKVTSLNTDDDENRSVGSDSVFMDEMDTEDEAEEFSTDSDVEFDDDDFTDDYSFCETGRRPLSRQGGTRILKYFASMESYDGSESIALQQIDQPVRVEHIEEDKRGAKPIRRLSRQFSTNLPRQTSLESRTKRKLVKTHSEPRERKTGLNKQLPAWTGKGRSGYVPKRQLSVPKKQSKRQEEQDETKIPELSPSMEDFKRKVSETPSSQFPPTSPTNRNSTGSSSDSPTLKQTQIEQIQGSTDHMPSTPSLKHKKLVKLQKQHSMLDDNSQSLLPILGDNLLKLPQISISGSCEHLAGSSAEPCLSVPSITINIGLGSSEKLNVDSDNVV